jgi:hypothetical protein
MGDEEGPWFGSCDKWSLVESSKCYGVLSPGGKIALGIGIPVGVGLIAVVCVLIYRRVISKPTMDPEYEMLQ